MRVNCNIAAIAAFAFIALAAANARAAGADRGNDTCIINYYFLCITAAPGTDTGTGMRGRNHRAAVNADRLCLICFTPGPDTGACHIGTACLCRYRAAVNIYWGVRGVRTAANACRTARAYCSNRAAVNRNRAAGAIAVTAGADAGANAALQPLGVENAAIDANTFALISAPTCAVAPSEERGIAGLVQINRAAIYAYYIRRAALCAANHAAAGPAAGIQI